MSEPHDGDPPTEITVYGTSWCPDVRRSRAVLDQTGVSYGYVDLDTDKAATRRVRKLQKGARRIPTIVMADGTVLIEPDDDTLRRHLPR